MIYVISHVIKLKKPHVGNYILNYVFQKGFHQKGNFQQLAGETSVLLSLRRAGGRRGGSLRRDSAVVKC